jgi:glycosyltransferase involved in cell wall biosynthesis
MLSVLIATYKRPEGLRRVLAALRPQVEGRTDREVIVVNDGTDDAAYAAVIGEHPYVRYHPEPENRGVGATRNAAARLARGTFIVYTDDDCEPPAWWLDWVAARLEEYPDIDVLAGTTRPLWTPRRSFVERVQAHYDLIPHPWRAGMHDMFVTANVAIRRALFERAGGFRVQERFLRAGEDTELCFRLAMLGARMMVDRNCYVRHEVGGRLRDQMRRYWGYGYANVWITRLTTAPAVHSEFAEATRRGLPAQLRWAYDRARTASRGFSASRLQTFASVLAATGIQVSHYLGCIRAARDARRAAASR